MNDSFVKKFKPKFYKKGLFIGNKRVFKFTKEYTKKFFIKTIWFVVLFLIVITMVFGTLAAFMNTILP